MVVIWHLSAIQFSDKTIVSGVLLNNSLNTNGKTNNWLNNANQVIGSYFKKTCRYKEVLVTCNNHTIKTVTDKNGGFSIAFNFKIENEIIIQFSESKTPLTAAQIYPVLFKDPPSGLNVISDIDETIIVSYTSTILKRFFTTLFKTSEKRTVISYTQELFNSLKDKTPRFFYVSKSEQNLFKIISNFIQFNELPEGPLILTPYLNFTQLIGSKKVQNFKLDSIEKIITNSINEEFILVGDDSQRDMEIYTVIVKKYTSMISKVYIRQTKTTRNNKQQQYWNALQETGVNAHYFKQDELFSS